MKVGHQIHPSLQSTASTVHNDQQRLRPSIGRDLLRSYADMDEDTETETDKEENTETDTSRYVCHYRHYWETWKLRIER